MNRPQWQRVAAYNVCVDDRDRLLLCRLTDQTERPGWWTLPGGGIDFGEHPEAGAIRELGEETGLTGHVRDLLAVDSIRRVLHDPNDEERDYHAIRIIYRTEVDDAELVHETTGSTDRARWCTRAELETMDLLELAHLGVRLAFGPKGETEIG